MMKLHILCQYIFIYCIILPCDAKEVNQQMKHHITLSKKGVKTYNYNSSFLSAKSSSTVHSGSQDNQMKADKIYELPGQPKIDFDQYGGYITVDPKNGRALYYYFVESQQNSIVKPLLLWLNGGPGCSTIGYGAMMENGPFRVNKHGKTLARNYYSWNKAANVLYVDSPAGTSFSYSNTSSDYTDIKDDRITTDLYSFLIIWLERFPQYKSRDFFIAGESYAGRMIPPFAQHIVRNNKMKNSTTINLNGIAIGNPSMDIDIEREENYKLEWSHSLIPYELYQTIKECNFTSDGPKNCIDAFGRENRDISEISITNMYEPKVDCYDPNSTSEMYNPDPCLLDYVTTYLRMGEVQKALHANVTNLPFPWEHCSFDRMEFTDEDKPVLPVIKELIEERISVWIYSGNIDMTIPTLATQRVVKSLGLPIKNEWSPWYNKNEVGGYIEEYEGLTFVMIMGAGHMVPMDQPERALVMISHFLEMKSLIIS